MNKLCYFLLVIFMYSASACRPLYNYVQVFKIEAADKESQESTLKQSENNLFFENNECAIHYAFWCDGGTMSFIFHNKTDKIMYIDLTKSFVIKNGIASNYYADREWSNSKTTNTTIGNTQTLVQTQSKQIITNVGIINSSTDIASLMTRTTSIVNNNIYNSNSANYSEGKTITVSHKEPDYIAIPPKASKLISSLNIKNNLLLDCDLERYPEDKATMEYSMDNSPLHFSNYITYNYGEGTSDTSIENKFYISSVTNYAEPSIIEFVKKEKPCQNLTTDTRKIYKKEYPISVYDLVVIIDTSNRFYLTYDIRSRRNLYHIRQKYYYNYFYDGYIKNSY